MRTKSHLWQTTEERDERARTNIRSGWPDVADELITILGLDDSTGRGANFSGRGGYFGNRVKRKGE